jgi:hypothetical protein
MMERLTDERRDSRNGARHLSDHGLREQSPICVNVTPSRRVGM